MMHKTWSKLMQSKYPAGMFYFTCGLYGPVFKL